MLIGVMSDIHANIKALEIANKKLKDIGAEEILVCGDIVGYGKNPNECCDLLREEKYNVVVGNHDWGLLGRNGISGFHKSIFEHKAIITNKNYKWLDKLPLVDNVLGVEFSHAEFISPEKFNYLHSCAYSYRNEQFKAISSDICFIGHSHFKETFVEEKETGRIIHTLIKGNGDMQQFFKKNRAIVSVGSVGICCSHTKKRNVVLYNTANRSVKYIEF